jgi:hypothetical protein
LANLGGLPKVAEKKEDKRPPFLFYQVPDYLIFSSLPRKYTAGYFSLVGP